MRRRPLEEPPRSFLATDHLTNCASSSRTYNYVKNRLAPAQASSGVGIGTSHSFELHIDTENGRWAASDQGQDLATSGR